MFRASFRRFATYKRFDNGPAPLDLRGILTSRWVQGSVLGLGAFYTYNLDRAPITGRVRCLWVPYFMERKIGDMSYKQILYQFGGQLLPTSHPLYHRIGTIMNQLLSTAIRNTPDQALVDHLKSLKWQIHIINVDQNTPPNAFILPNGKIFVFLSILGLANNDAGLATVLSHELSHQLARHSSEQLSGRPLIMAFSILASLALSSSLIPDLIIKSVYEMPASREMETEADRIGLELMARLCYDVREALGFWKRMDAWRQQHERVGRLSSVLEGFLSTHPTNDKRVHDITTWLPELEAIKESSGCYDHQFGWFQEAKRDFFR